MSCYGLGEDDPSFRCHISKFKLTEDHGTLFNFIFLMLERATGGIDEDSQQRYPASPT